MLTFAIFSNATTAIQYTHAIIGYTERSLIASGWCNFSIEKIERQKRQETINVGLELGVNIIKITVLCKKRKKYSWN